MAVFPISQDLSHHQDSLRAKVETDLWTVLSISQDLADHQDTFRTQVKTDLWAVLRILQDLACHQDKAHTLPDLPHLQEVCTRGVLSIP